MTGTELRLIAPSFSLFHTASLKHMHTLASHSQEILTTHLFLENIKCFSLTEKHSEMSFAGTRR